MRGDGDAFAAYVTEDGVMRDFKLTHVVDDALVGQMCVYREMEKST